MLLALVEVEEPYTKEQIVAKIFTVPNQYHIKEFFSHFVIDNNTTNNYMVTSTLDQFFEKNGLNYNSQQHRLRQNDHIINLSWQAFLFRSLPEDVILDFGR